jgi:spore coat protein U-like protein
MPMNRFLLTSCAVLLSLPSWAQRVKPPGEVICPVAAAECTMSLPVMNFGQQVMNPGTAPIHGHGMVSVTCTRSPRATGRSVDVVFTLKAEPAEPTRAMRDRTNVEYQFVRYFLYLDPGRTRHWGDGIQYGTHAITGTLLLDDRNRVGTLAYMIYGTVDGGQTVTPGPKLGAVLNRLQYDPICH